MKKIRKKHWIILGITIIILISLIIGGKIYMDNQAAKQQAEEWKQYLAYQKDGARRIQQSFSDITEIKFVDASDGAPGDMVVYAILTTTKGDKVNINFIEPQDENYADLGNLSGGIPGETRVDNDWAKLSDGITSTPIKVSYSISKNKSEVETLQPEEKNPNKEYSY